ncbi:MAG: hypothetical protein KA731_03130 [Candidatus Moranbacteria bacterium]|nr:hypothetical protein [Candidatus Moranbacteria bacterium]MBP6034380.1 hypothetical protein [Candidatus Moranbacteria bacterium]
MRTYTLPICLQREVVAAYHKEQKFLFLFLRTLALLLPVYVLYRLSALTSGGVTGLDLSEKLQPDLASASMIMVPSIFLLLLILKVKIEAFWMRLDWALLCQKYATVSGRIMQIKVDSHDSGLLYLTLHSRDNEEAHELKITKATWDVSANLLSSCVMIFYDAKSKMIHFVGPDY